MDRDRLHRGRRARDARDPAEDRGGRGGVLRYLIPIGVVAAVLVAAATGLWGWPGTWAALALLPAVLIGGTVGHVRGAFAKRNELRVGVIGLGLGLSLVAVPGSLLFMSAVNAPEEIVVEESIAVAGAPEHVWTVVGDPIQRTRWSTWLKEIEPIGDLSGPSVGRRYRSTIELAGMPRPAEQHVTALDPGRELAWQVGITTGASLEDLVESVRLEADPAGTRVTYRLSYRVPTVVSRVASRLLVEGTFRELAHGSLAQLARVVGE